MRKHTKMLLEGLGAGLCLWTVALVIALVLFNGCVTRTGGTL